MSILRNDTCLIRLGNISEDYVNTKHSRLKKRMKQRLLALGLPFGPDKACSHLCLIVRVDRQRQVPL